MPPPSCIGSLSPTAAAIARIEGSAPRVYLAVQDAWKPLEEKLRLRFPFGEETVGLRAKEYYHDSLRLLALLLGSGRMPPPSALTAGDGAR